MSDYTIHMLGFGRLGRYLFERVAHTSWQIGEIYNRTKAKIDVNHPAERKHDDLQDFIKSIKAHSGRQLVFEASHPDVVEAVGRACLDYADLMVTSLTALMKEALLGELEDRAKEHYKTVFIPEGAGWGIQNIRKMNALNQLTKMEIDMYFSPGALRMTGEDQELLDQYVASASQEPILVAEGPVRSLATRAPNNVNTMCAVRLAANSLSDELVIGRLWADQSQHAHRVRIRTHGPDGFYTDLLRYNPAIPGAVTGQMTFSSFWSSVMAAERRSDVISETLVFA